jgi:hypothetical protein
LINAADRSAHSSSEDIAMRCPPTGYDSYHK